eukprot:COSAG01_NODE_24281_length_784_cov_1.284672_2_plen_24_part_01
MLVEYMRGQLRVADRITGAAAEAA